MRTIGALQSIWDGFDFTYILSIVLAVIPSLLCITLHEMSHGYTALLLGDTTAKDAGRLTLNPIKHLDPMGLLMLAVFHVGWAKPVPINMFKFKDPKKGMALTALAGPASNLLIALVFMFLYGVFFIPLRSSTAGEYFLTMLQLTVYISLGYMLFNLIPVPPLDGSKVLFSLLDDKKYVWLMRYEKYGSLVMLALVATGLVGRPLSAAIDWLFDLLLPIAQGGCDAVFYLFYR
ncbi:MAG: site-2 protease family protein [Eubacteriales bacterium]|nr:site-2 protease family protein [Eubacteriales bacterium]